jgi:RNA polymerase sigma-70 factor (ECF subfamily)
VQGFSEVLVAARLGEPWAFRALYDSYGGRVHGYVRGKGAPEPDEVTNDVFAQAFTSLHRFDGDEAAFRSWLFTVAHRRLVDAYRRASKEAQALPYDVEADSREEPSAEAGALDRLGEERVRQLLDRLAPDQRDVLLLRLVGDLTVDQVAEALGKRPGAIKALQRRGLASLVKLLDDQAVTK